MEKNKSRFHRVKHHVGKAVSRAKSVSGRLRRNKPASPEKDYPLIDTKLKQRLLAALSYLHILVLIPYFLGKENEFVRYHSRQGIALLAVWSFGILLLWLPVVGWLLAAFLLTATVIGLVNVFKSKQRRLPVIGKAALL